MILNPYGVHILCNFSSTGSRLRRQPGAIDISPLRGSSIIKHICTGIRAKWRHLIALYNAPYNAFGKKTGRKSLSPWHAETLLLPP